MPQGMIPAKALDPFIDGIRRLEAKVEKLEEKNNDLVSVLTEIVDIYCKSLSDWRFNDEVRLNQLMEIGKAIINQQ